MITWTKGLNKGFQKAERIHANCQKRVKSQLPRRESERRAHSLYRHVEILSSIETRLSLLNMTFMKFIEADLCCFIPGKVLDELFRLLRNISRNQVTRPIHEELRELRDITSMAMEYFEERVAPNLRNKLVAHLGRPLLRTTSLPSIVRRDSSRTPTPSPSPRNQLSSFSTELTSELVKLTQMVKELTETHKRERKEFHKKIQERDQRLDNLEKELREQKIAISDQERRLNELTRKQLLDESTSPVVKESSRLNNDTETLNDGWKRRLRQRNPPSGKRQRFT